MEDGTPAEDWISIAKDQKGGGIIKWKSPRFPDLALTRCRETATGVR